MNPLIRTTIIWLICAIVAFNVLVVNLFRFGAVSSTRDEQGHLKRRQSGKGIASILLVLVLFVSVIVVYDFSLFKNTNPPFAKVLLFNFVLVMGMVLYDSFVIDYLVIGIIRPRFLKLPETMNLDSMKQHIKKQFSLGWIFVLPLIALPALIYWWTF